MNQTINQDFRRLLRPASQMIGKRWANIHIRVTFHDGRLALSGVVGALASGNARGGCGQIDMEFAHRDPADNDLRYDSPITPDQLRFAPGWDAERWLDLLAVWARWHLNDMNAACAHQRTIRQIEAKLITPCPVCGYEYGTAWVREEVPAETLAWLPALPEADKPCLWNSF